MDFITFANHVLQEIANQRLPFIQNTISGSIEEQGTYKLIAGKIHGLTIAEEALRKIAAQWINGSAQAPEVRASIIPINPNIPSSTQSKPISVDEVA